MLQSVQAGAIRYHGAIAPFTLKVRMLKAEAVETVVRVEGVEYRPRALPYAPNGTPPSPPTKLWPPAPRTQRPPHAVRQKPRRIRRVAYPRTWLGGGAWVRPIGAAYDSLV